VAKSSGRHSIGPLRFQAWNPEWAFHPDAAESALPELLQRHHDFHLDRHHLDRLQRAQWHRLELPAVQVRGPHFVPQARHLRVDLYRRQRQVQRVRLAWPVLRPGQIRSPPDRASARTQSELRRYS
jgi:hypothetical protein